MMFKSKYIRLLIITIAMLLILIPTFTFASADTTQDVIQELQKQDSGPLSGIEKEAKTFSRDIFNISRVIVTAGLFIGLVFTFFKFIRAGDDINERARLKSRLAYISIGTILLMNFWRVISLLKSINLFN